MLMKKSFTKLACFLLIGMLFSSMGAACEKGARAARQGVSAADKGWCNK